MELSGQIYTSAAVFLGKNLGTYLIGSRVGPTKGLDGFGEEKSSYTRRVFNPGPSILYRVATPDPQNNTKMSNFSCLLGSGLPYTKNFVIFSSRLENN